MSVTKGKILRHRNAQAGPVKSALTPDFNAICDLALAQLEAKKVLAKPEPPQRQEVIRYTEISPDDICLCGHLKSDHVYNEGACRPGWTCRMKCEVFEKGFKMDGHGHWKFQEKAFAKKPNVEALGYIPDPQRRIR